jgi:hypothetical protein
MTVLIVGTYGSNSMISGFVPVAVAQNDKSCVGQNENRNLGPEFMSRIWVGWLAFTDIMTTPHRYSQGWVGFLTLSFATNATQQTVG